MTTKKILREERDIAVAVVVYCNKRVGNSKSKAITQQQHQQQRQQQHHHHHHNNRQQNLNKEAKTIIP